VRGRRAALLVVAALVVSMTAFASPASAAPRMRCSTLAGQALFTPPLPPTLDHTTVVTTVSASTGTNLGSCTGPGGLYGKLAFKAKATKAGNCTSLYNDGLTATGTGTIKWQKGKASTISVKLVLAKRAMNPLPISFTGTVKSGQFVGKLFTATLSLSISGRSCLQDPLSRTSMSLQKGTKFKLG
jgi:hypothetical protein